VHPVMNWCLTPHHASSHRGSAQWVKLSRHLKEKCIQMLIKLAQLPKKYKNT